MRLARPVRRSRLRGLTGLGIVALAFAVTAVPVTVRAQDAPAAPATSTDAAAQVAGHSYHGEVFNEGPRQAAYLMSGTGPVKFPVASTVADVQAFINQGVGQLHGFWYFEAERTFRQAAALDPKCASAFWGMAMANTNNRDRAKKFIAKAVELKDQETPRVQRYITALDALLKAEDAKAASDDYIKALEQIVYDHPDDIEAKAFIAVHLWEGRNQEQKIRSHLAVDALIQQVLDVEPMHPAHHYRIHLWDYERPERALASAALCGQAAPAIAHMWHMPGHIYSRLNRYPDAVWQQEASARTDHAQMMRDRVLPDQIHNFAHNNEWLIRNLVFIGKFDAALDLALNMVQLPRHPKYNLLDKSNTSSSYGRMRLLQVLEEGEMWQETLRLSATPLLARTDVYLSQVEWLRAVARAEARLGQFDEMERWASDLDELVCRRMSEQEQAGWKAARTAREQNKTAEEIKKAVEHARREFEGDLSRAQRAADELAGYRAAAAGKWAEAVKRMEKAADVDKRYVARLRLKAAMAEASVASGNGASGAGADANTANTAAKEATDRALQQLKEYVDSHKQETVPLAYLAELQWEADRWDEAAATMQRLRDLSAHIDLHAAPFSRLAPLAARLEWPRDWRIAATASTDVGNRPPLEQLGPFRWEPTEAPDWTLTNAQGQTVSLREYRGTPVVLIFYLGYGCLHCAEQLQAFGPQTSAFREAGIQILAISSDDAEGLRKSLENYTGGEIPFPLLANDTLDVFRQYRAFDDFENQPLHGTYLIDAAGKLRWHDIGHEPFMDHAFVLGEAQRLLAQPSQATFAGRAR